MKKDVENFGQEKNILRVGVLQLLCQEKLYKEEADEENEEYNTMTGRKN